MDIILAFLKVVGVYVTTTAMLVLVWLLFKMFDALAIYWGWMP